MKKGDYCVCPKCKGKGVVFDHELGIFTGGLGYLLQMFDEDEKMECPRCDGTGFVEVM